MPNVQQIHRPKAAAALALMAFPLCGWAQNTTVHKVDETLTIEALRTQANLKEQTATYSEGVKATYDLTVVRADRLVIYFASTELETAVLAAFAASSPWLSIPVDDEMRATLGLATRRAVATGNVVLTDPEGTIRADRLDFNWILKTGEADNVDLDVAGVSIQAEKARLAPGRIELLNAAGTSCRNEPPLYRLRARRVVITPGDRVLIERPKISILGREIVTLPRLTYALNDRVPGLRFPTVSFRRGEGFGVNWNSGVLLDENTSLTAGASIFPRRLPGYGIEIARSFVPATSNAGPISPRSEFAERFSYGYFENINIKTPEVETDYLSSMKDTISLASTWNQGAFSPDGRERLYTKPIDIAYEKGGSFGGLDMVHQARIHNIREVGGKSVNRLVTQSAVGLKPVEIGPNLMGHVRLNTMGFVNEGSFFGWARLSVGATYQPIPQLRIGGAFMFAGEAGDPAFDIDRLYSKNAFHLRGDLNLGPTKLSVLGKYDFRQKRWYDHEYSFSQVVGCLEPYVLWRQFPSDFRFGVTLRLDDFLDLLRRKDFKRRGTGVGAK